MVAEAGSEDGQSAAVYRVFFDADFQSDKRGVGKMQVVQADIG